MKKICICTTISSTMDSFVVPTAVLLYQECGYDVTLICNYDEKFKNSLPEYINYIPVKMARGIDASGFKSLLDFIKVFKREKFDLVQYSTPNAACYASIAAKLCKVPIRLYCQWGIRYVGLSGISRKIFKYIEKFVCKNSTHIRAVSPMNLKFAVSEGLYKPQKALVIGKGGTIGVDMKKYDISQKYEWRTKIRQQYNLDKNDIVFGFAGRISADKGCSELLNAFKNLISKNQSNIKLLVVGPVEDNCGIDTGLITWAKQNQNIIFTGRVNGADMREYYAAMDVLVHPTYREGFGMVLQEAGALSLAIITTKIPGASEVMENGKSCLLVESKNTDELEIVMRKFATDTELISKIGEAAYERTKTYFDRQIMLENQRKDYEKLLEN